MRLQEGDQVHLAVDENGLQELRPRVWRPAGTPGTSPPRRRKPAVRVAIAGAGNVGQFIAADLLAAGHQVTMIEKDLHVLEVARPA